MLIFAGLSHASAPLPVRERCAIMVAERSDLRDELARLVGPVVALATCGRLEFYCDVPAEESEVSLRRLARWFDERHGAGDAPIGPYLQFATGGEVVSRALRVACGLDSAVRGEDEILGQTRRAWLDAGLSGTLSPSLDALFRLAVRTGREARRIGSVQMISSLADAAAARVTRSLAQRQEPRLLIAGSGPMGMRAARLLREQFGADLHIWMAGRTPARVAAHAAQVAARPLCLGDLPEALAWADAVVVGLRTRTPLIQRVHITERGARPLLIADLSLPRAVEPEVGQLPGVRLCDVDHLGFGDAGSLRWNAAEQAQVERMVENAARNFAAANEPIETLDTLRSLRLQAEGIRQSLLSSTLRRLPQLDEDARYMVDALTRALVNRVLHEPTMRLKHAGDGELPGQARALFGLDTPSENAGASVPRRTSGRTTAIVG